MHFYKYLSLYSVHACGKMELEYWLFIAYILGGLLFWMLMFLVINPRTVVRRIERWAEGGKFDDIIKNFMDRYGPVILGAVTDQIVQRIQMSIRGNQGVVSKTIKKAQQDLSKEILSTNVPLLSQLLTQTGMSPKDPMMASLASQILAPYEQKAQLKLSDLIEQRMGSPTQDPAFAPGKVWYDESGNARDPDGKLLSNQ